jgi:hypothetical protein
VKRRNASGRDPGCAWVGIVLYASSRSDKAGGTTEITRDGETPTKRFGKSDPYRLELEEFAATIRERRERQSAPNEILGNARATSALLNFARSGGGMRKV